MHAAPTGWRTVIVLAAGALMSPAGDASTGERAAAEVGRSLYRQHCSRCHGFNLINSGAAAPDLRKFPADQQLRFVAIVLQGKGAMPAWQAVLSAEDVNVLWGYVSAAAAPR